MVLSQQIPTRAAVINSGRLFAGHVTEAIEPVQPGPLFDRISWTARDQSFFHDYRAFTILFISAW